VARAQLASITYLHLALLYDKIPQMLASWRSTACPSTTATPRRPREAARSPGRAAGRARRFIVEGPAAGAKGLLITRSVNTGQDGENDPNRPWSRWSHPPAPRSRARGCRTGARRSRRRRCPGWARWSRSARASFTFRRPAPIREPPESDAVLHHRRRRKAGRVRSRLAAAEYRGPQGDVEDWIIENRSLELHDFHIHQLHFQLREWYGYEVDEPFLRDTVSVPFFDNHLTSYPSVRLRMDFSRPEHRRYVPVPLPSPRTRGRRNDGYDSCGAAAGRA